MKAAYPSAEEDNFENRALRAYHERAQLTRLLTLQQSLLSQVMRGATGPGTMENVLRKVATAFAADGVIIAVDRPSANDPAKTASAGDGASASAKSVQPRPVSPPPAAPTAPAAPNASADARPSIVAEFRERSAFGQRSAGPRQTEPVVPAVSDAHHARRLAHLLRTENVPLALAQRLGTRHSLEGKDGPVHGDQRELDQPFSWFWCEGFSSPGEGDAPASGGRIFLLFNEERLPSSEDRLAMNSVGPHVQMVLHSIVQNEAIAHANERFATLAATIPGVVYQRRVRQNGEIRYTYISETAEELFGVSAHEILTNPAALFSCYAPEYGDTFRKRLLEASRKMTTWDVEASIVMPDGTKKYTHAIARPEKEADGSVLWTGVILDATRMKLAEMAAAETEKQTREDIVNSLPQGFLLFDKQDRLILINHHFDISPDFKDAIPIGSHYEDVVRAELLTGIDRAKTPEELAERLAARLLNHRAHQYFSTERQLAEDLWLEVSEKRTEDGRTVVLFTNINKFKRHEVELERHANRLEHANTELQQFAYVASHDLQEPLRKIEAFGDRLIKRCGDQLDDNGKLYTERMMNASGRMRSLINDLLSYSRVGKQEPNFVTVDLTQIARDVASDLEEVISEKNGRVDIETLPTVEADPTQMRQLFQNLVSNSLKYSDPERPPVVDIRCEIEDGVSAHLQFTDNGIGFEQHHADRIFEVFQRLHGRSEYAGTGIGLATCRRIVDRHHGKITAVSEVGAGSLFSVVLPIEQKKLTISGGGDIKNEG
ncbi:MAG: ATP-binding protein [Pseudomonadota bacterium]